MDREAWHAAIHGVAKSPTWLSNWTDNKLFPKLVGITEFHPLSRITRQLKQYDYIHCMEVETHIWIWHIQIEGERKKKSHVNFKFLYHCLWLALGFIQFQASRFRVVWGKFSCVELFRGVLFSLSWINMNQPVIIICKTVQPKHQNEKQTWWNRSICFSGNISVFITF